MEGRELYLKEGEGRWIGKDKKEKSGKIIKKTAYGMNTKIMVEYKQVGGIKNKLKTARIGSTLPGRESVRGKLI